MQKSKFWKQGLLAGLLCTLPLLLPAQDDLMKMLEEEQEPEIDYTFATFKGTRLINLQSPQLPGKGVLQYIFVHRFGAFNQDYFYNFLGMNTAEVRLQVDYSFLEWLNAGLGYGSAAPRTYDGFFKYRMLRQSTGKVNMPVSVVGYSGMYYNAERFNDDLPHHESERLSFVNQLIIARKFTQDFSFEIVPTHVHFNMVNLREESNDLFSLGFGARYKITHMLTLTAEYIYQLNPLETDLQSTYPDIIERKNHNVLSAGVNIETGGHVFQLFLTNSRGVSDPYTIAQTPGTWGNGDIHFGFNISRVFTIQKPEEFSED